MEVTHQEYDHLWKEVITELFEEFLLFFSPELFEEIDFTSQPEFLEQELHTIIPDSKSNHRYADKLVKLKLKNGQEQWVFIHIEVQGGYKKDFSKRMFQYFYRVMDLYDQQIFALAIFTSNVSTNKMTSFHYDFFGTHLNYHYNTYRIASQSEIELLQLNNPFALAVLAGLYLINSNKDIDLKYKYKQKLMRLILQDKMKVRELYRKTVQQLFIFIDHILRLPDNAEGKMYKELKPLIEKEDTHMGLSLEDTAFAKFARKEAREEGLKEGRKEGRKEGIEQGEKQKAIEIATRILKKGGSEEEVADITGLPLVEVIRLKGSLD
ncbi:MAG: Rpn family recombination-promoting nuclease/putative transposase [Bacillota bacterium]